MGVTVAVCTWQGPGWRQLSATRNRAIASAKAAGADDVIVVHLNRDDAAGARNAALDQVQTEHVVYLDADDELEPGYLAALTAGDADLRAPSVRYVRNAADQAPARMPRVAGHDHDCTGECLPYGNWLVVGTLARADLLRKVGGWHDYPWSEDWDLWLRCHLAGATVEAVPDAVYRAYVRFNSRNRGASRAARLAAHRAIATANGVPVP